MISKEEFFVLMEDKVMQRCDEIPWIYERVSKLNPTKILEIGTCGGGLTSLLAFTGAKVVTVDINDVAGGIWNWPEVSEALGDKVKNITAIQGSSQLQETADLVRPFGPFDIVVIDGDHSWEGGYRDWELYSPMATKMIAIHDACEYWDKHGPEYEWDWFPSEFAWEVTDHPGPRGIKLDFEYTTDELCARPPDYHHPLGDYLFGGGWIIINKL